MLTILPIHAVQPESLHVQKEFDRAEAKTFTRKSDERVRLRKSIER